MFDSFMEGLLLVLQWKAFSLMLVGMALGFCVGLLPGIGGAATLALMIPFIFKMSPAEAFAFLLGMHSVAATTGDITSVLFGVPGEAISAATVVDGYPMAKKGEAGRALGAALMSSLLGALIGAFALALAIPIVRPLVLTFGSAELFMLSLIGISCITSISGSNTRGQIKGFAMGLFGLLVSTIGQERQSGSLRFDMGMMYLWEGLDFVPVLVGIFAISEIIDLGVPGSCEMAILLSGFLIMGIMPGTDMLTKHLALTFSMVWTLAIANVITVLLCLLVLDQLAKLTYVRGGLIIPFVLLLVFVGSYTANNQITDLIVTLIFGVLSYFMVLFGWPRPPFVLGFVLGKVIETYLFISMSRYGFSWLTHPIVIVLIVLMAAVIAYPSIQQRRQRIGETARA